MNLIFIAAMVALLLLNLAGITVATRRVVPPYALARSIGIVVLCLALFFVEHFVGLGRLTWVWPISSVISVVLLYRERQQLAATGFWRAEVVFYIAFFYVFAWKFAFPQIYPSSERVTDLYFISNYLGGDRLPPLDRWYPPHVFNVYYAFQHYAAALMGRILGLDGGTAYGLAFALLMALPATLAWELVGRYVRRTWVKWLLLVVLVSGATGMSPLMPWVRQMKTDVTADKLAEEASDRVVASQRFIGSLDQGVNTPLGEALFPRLKPEQKPDKDFEPRELPLESYGYQVYLGDYHPPLGGYFLLLLALALIGAIETGAVGNVGQGLLAATVPLVIVTNTWVFPLQGLLVAAWVGYRYWERKPPSWAWLLGGAFLVLALTYPFLSDFAVNAQTTPIRLVNANDHTPLTRFIGMHWPLLVLLLLGLVEPTHRKLSITLAITLGVMLLVSELVFVDDPTGGKYERTNTTMKWWGWIWCAGLVGLGTLSLGSASRWVRWAATLTLLPLCIYAYDLGRYYVLTGKGDLGYLSGHHWMTQDATAKAMVGYLKDAPDGIVLENQYDNAYDNTTLYALFGGKPAMLGWPLHLVTWRGEVPDVWALKSQVEVFYAGKLTGTVDWLLANQVRYVVWSPDDNSKKTPHAFENISQQIGARYRWKEFYSAGDDYRVGVWVRVP